MSEFAQSFFRTAATQKLQQNHRTMKQMSTVIAKSTVEQIKQQQSIQELEETLLDYKISLDQVKAHNEAESARSAYLMDLLDQAYGKDDNPARQIAHPEQDFRIPSGVRKGEMVTKADEVYLTRFSEVFKAKHAKTWKDYFKSWVEFIHPRISY